MTLLQDTIFYHVDGLVKIFPEASDAPGAGWQDRPWPDVTRHYASSDPFDHDGDGRPGGSRKRK